MVIVAAVDGEKRPDPVVDVGRELSDAFDEELVVLHVMPEAEFERRRSEREYYVDQAVSDASKTAGWVVDDVFDDDEAVTLSGAVGEPVEEILELGHERDARYLVVGGRKRTPVGKAVFGSVTQSVLLEADRPVVTVMSGEPE